MAYGWAGVSVPALSHCCVLTVQLVHHQAQSEPDKTEVNTDPDVELSGRDDVQTIGLTRMLSSLKTNTALSAGVW